jgi:hypothetical protein
MLTTEILLWLVDPSVAAGKMRKNEFVAGALLEYCTYFENVLQR